MKASADNLMVILGPIAVIVAVLFAWATGMGKRDPNKWYGTMVCNNCGYGWQARRSTPPARCPRCSSNRVNSQMG